MTKIKLINSLIEQINILIDMDFDSLEGLRSRARMIVRTVFGAESEYLEEMKQIHFSSMVIFSGETHELDYAAWNSGKNNLFDLFMTMKEELNMLGIKEEEGNQHNGAPIIQDEEITKTIFIVHGHDEASLLSVARFLDHLDLDPIILHEQPSEGRTVIEKVEDYSDVGFSVVLLTPDDRGGLKSEPYDKQQSRARQNVIFELGYFIGKLGRENVVALHKEGVEILSDFEGVVYIPFDDNGAWKLPLSREMKARGLDIDLNKAL